MKRLIILLIILLFAWPCFGATYTVCSSGCDETTIQAVFDNNDLAPGDIVEVRADTVGGSATYTETVTWGANDDGAILQGRSGDTITIDSEATRAYCITGAGDAITIKDISTTDATDAGIYMTGGAGITIDNVNSSSNDDEGIFLNDVTGAIVVKNCTTNSNSKEPGIRIHGSVSDATTIDVYDNTSNTNGKHGVTVQLLDGCTINIYDNTFNTNVWDAVLFENCLTSTINIYDNYCSGNNTGANGATILIEDSEDVNIFRNTILDSDYIGIRIASDAAGATEMDNCKIYSNIIDTADHDGIQVWLANAGCDSITGLLIANNTIYTSGGSGTRHGITLYAADVETIAGEIRNNIISEATGRMIWVNEDTGVTWSNNGVYDSGGVSFYYSGGANCNDGVCTLAEWQTDSGSTNDVEGDPDFVDAANLDFHLLVSSPCIGAGTPIPTIVKTDIDGQPTTDPHVDGRVDIGADRVISKLDMTGASTAKYLLIDGGGGNYAGLTLSGGQTINNDTIARCVSGALRVDGNVTTENVAFDDECYIMSGVTLTANNCAFQEAEAVVAVDGTITDTDCQFSVSDFGFIDKSNGDFRLTGDSVCVGTGFDTGVERDVRNRRSPCGKRHDIGAYESTTVVIPCGRRFIPIYSP